MQGGCFKSLGKITDHNKIMGQLQEEWVLDAVIEVSSIEESEGIMAKLDAKRIPYSLKFNKGKGYIVISDINSEENPRSFDVMAPSVLPKVP